MKPIFPSALLLLAVCSLPMDGRTTETFVDARTYPTQAVGWERFRAVEARLVGGFNDVCGDTFCEGEYHNLQALRFRCSVEAASGRVEECVWTFTGSTARVDAASGAIVVDARTWACRAPLAANTQLPVLLQTLEQGQALHAPLPGTPDSMYDGLTECL
ncbi:hypothetical protein [Stenotrophomonas rhizophila]|nr:hypothetical protein [Gammaproteobacteria bacterium]